MSFGANSHIKIVGPGMEELLLGITGELVAHRRKLHSKMMVCVVYIQNMHHGCSQLKSQSATIFNGKVN
jgi:hypothetical protein